jgi:hypothetical protein
MGHPMIKKLYLSLLALAAVLALGEISYAASNQPLGSSVSVTSPQRGGDATTGLYTAGSGLVDVSISGSKIVEWSSTGEAITGTLSVSGNTTLNITGSTQCIHANSSGVLSGTGSDCGSGTASLTVGSTTISAGTTTRVLFDNAGTLGEYVISGTGNVAMTTNGVFTTPNLGTPSAVNLTNATALPTSALPSNQTFRSITYVIDGGGSAITTGVKGTLVVPFACTINSATLIADQSGSIVVDIWKKAFASTLPTVANTITASDIPTLSSAVTVQDTTLTGWTTSVSANDMITYNVNSASTVTRVTIALKCTAS